MRVILVEDQALLREGLAGLFRDAGHEVVASLGDCTESRTRSGITRQTSSSWTSGCPHRSPTRAPVRLPRSSRRGRTWASCSSHNTSRRRTAWRWPVMGGFGYLLKDRVLDVSEFLGAVARVADGGSALDPQVVAALLNRNAGQDRLAQLTEREHEVLRLMAQGMTNTGIAKRLVLSERTVEAHVRRLLLKLDIADSEDANRRVIAVLLHLGVTSAPIAAETGERSGS